MLNKICYYLSDKITLYSINLQSKRLWLFSILAGYFYFLYNLISVNSDQYETSYVLTSIFPGIILSIILLSISFIDILFMYIPKSICKVGICLGIVFISILGALKGWPEGVLWFLEHIFAAISGYLSMKILSFFSERVLGQEALGLGDASIVALGGVWIGFIGISLAIAIAFISAGIFSAVALVSGKLKRLEAFPFAPFISAGILGVWLFEPNWWSSLWLSLWGF